MKAILLCEESDMIFNVFDKKTRRGLSELVKIEEKIYTKADVLGDPNRFVGVEFVFSTWDMPVFSEEEIRATLPSLKCIFYGAGTMTATEAD